MNNLAKKPTHKICMAIFGLTLLCTTSASVIAETLEERIKNLESLVKELKQQVEDEKQIKKRVKRSAADDKHTFKVGGFIKLTGSFSGYSDGDLASGSAGRDFYIPGTIPIGGEDESADFDFSAKETRIYFKSKHRFDNGETVATHIEMDFLLPPGGNERVSNSYNPRLRHAYFTYSNWLFGQTWSTFQDVAALPEAADFLGASEGIIFVRQPLVRYTNGPWQFALENPESTITPFGGGGRLVTDDNYVPDFVARYNHKADWGHITLSALLRQLSFESGTIDDSILSGGVSLTGKVKVGAKDDIRFNFAGGAGLGRYVGLNVANGAVLDVNGDLETIDSILAAIAYRHFWSPKWRSNLILSSILIDNDTALAGTGATESVSSFQVNLLHSPISKLTLALGLLYAERELESGDDGSLLRAILSAKYAF